MQIPAVKVTQIERANCKKNECQYKKTFNLSSSVSFLGGNRTKEQQDVTKLRYKNTRRKTSS